MYAFVLAKMFSNIAFALYTDVRSIEHFLQNGMMDVNTDIRCANMKQIASSVDKISLSLLADV